MIILYMFFALYILALFGPSRLLRFSSDGVLEPFVFLTDAFAYTFLHLACFSFSTTIPHDAHVR